MTRNSIISCLVVALASMKCALASAGQIIVDPDAGLYIPGYREPTIQAAIDAAADGDVVIVEHAVYEENIDFLGKAITVRSSDPQDWLVVFNTVISGGESGSCVTFQNGEGQDSVLSGFRITHGKADRGGGIYCSGASPTITNNVIVRNEADWEGGGIYWYSGLSPVIHGNTIEFNNAPRGAGVFCDGCKWVTITENRFIANSYEAIRCEYYWGSVVVADNVFAGNYRAVVCDHCAEVTVTRNTFFENEQGGVSCGECSVCTLTDNTLEGGMAGLAASDCDQAAITGNVITGGAGIGAGPEKDEQTAIIADNIVTDSFWTGIGGFGWRGSTTITGNVVADCAAEGVLCDGDVAVTDNFITGSGRCGISIESGPAVITGNTIVDNDYAGVYTRDSLMGVFVPDTTVVVTDNTISRNSGGLQCSGYWTIANNRITSNSPSGGIRLVGCEAVVVGNLVAGNYNACEGGAFDCRGLGHASLICNTVVGNTAGQTGDAMSVWQVFGAQMRIRIVDSILSGNGGPDAARIALDDGQEGLSLTIAHSLVEGGLSSIDVGEGWVLTWGPGNIDADPLFVDPGYWEETVDPDHPWAPPYTFVPGDYHLLPGSPCIDAGTNDVDNPETEQIEELPETDIAGLPRIIDGDLDGTFTVDMGAYEYLPGDVNYDGKLNVLDLIFIRNLLGVDPASVPAARQADLNADGTIDMLDLVAARNQMGKR